MTILVALTPEGQAAARNLATFPSRLMPAIARGLDSALEVGHQQTLKRRFTGKGPFPVSESRLGVRSGLLRTSFLRSPAKESGGVITAGIGSNVKYWLPHELGFDGTVTVRAHTRQTARGAKGEIIFLRTARRSRAKARPVITRGSVRAHTRHLRIPKRAPMFTGLTEQVPEMSRLISHSIVKEWNGGRA